MTNKLLDHKGYKGTVEVDTDEDILFGKVICIQSLLMYHGENVNELRAAFCEVVDDYLKHCETHGIEPNKPLTGSFNVRIGEERHKALVMLSAERGCCLNDLIQNGVDLLLHQQKAPEIHNHMQVVVIPTGSPVSLLSSSHLEWKTERVTSH